METQRFYTIMVGGAEPANVLFGTLNKTNGLPDENAIEGKIGVGLDVMPNYSRVWGKRGEGKDKRPNGEIEFLVWGDPRGEAIEIRYLPNSRSLDLAYQANVEKLKVQDKDAEISLHLGINKFDYKDKAPLIEMLKHHTFNGDNKSRDPSNSNISFVEYNPSNKIKANTQKIHMRRLAEEYVLECDGEDKSAELAVLAALFELNTQNTDEVLYENLLQRAMDNPQNFIFIIQHHKDLAKIALEQAADQNLLDFSVEGNISLRRQSSKELIVDGLEELETKEDKIKFISSNLTVPKYYEAVKKVSTLLREFQHVALQ